MDPILDAPLNYQTTLLYAGFWVRFGAYVIDAVLLAAVNYIMNFIINPGEHSDVLFMSVGVNFLAMGVNLIINVVYFASMESSERQGSLGKRAVGIKVCDLNGERISFANGVGRYFAKILSFLILLIGFIMVLLDEKKQVFMISLLIHT